MTYSIVLLVPIKKQDHANALGEALGWGPNNFSLMLSEDGTEPATYCALRSTVTQDFVDMMAGAGKGTLPDADWATFSLTKNDVFSVLDAMVSDLRPDQAGIGREHFQSALDVAGLRLVGDVLDA